MGTFPWNTVSSLIGLRVPQGYTLIYHMVGSSVVYDARENIVRHAQKHNCDYVFFIDSDMVIPSDAIPKMIKTFETSDADIITGMAFKRIPPFQPCWYTKISYDLKKYKPMQESPVEFPKEGIMKIEGCGMACCMIRMSLFDKIKSPYFYPLPHAGEDLSFCYKAKAVKANMYCDLSINTGHVASFPIDRNHFDTYYEEYKKSNNKKQIFGGDPQ